MKIIRKMTKSVRLRDKNGQVKSFPLTMVKVLAKNKVYLNGISDDLADEEVLR